MLTINDEVYKWTMNEVEIATNSSNIEHLIRIIIGKYIKTIINNELIL